jgi:hypothetical protein
MGTSSGAAGGSAGNGGNGGTASNGGGAGDTNGGDASPLDAATNVGNDAASTADANDAGGNGGWVPIFNGQDLTHWYPLVRGFPYKTDPYNTFRVSNGVIKVTYENYPGGNFDNHFGLLYYDKPLTNYRVRVEYHFLEPQAGNPPGWGRNNTGLMVFGIDPSKVTGDPSFPPLLEIQLLGTPSSGGTNNANLCKPGGPTVKLVNGKPPGPNCDPSSSGPARPAAEWVTVEAEVHVNGDTKVYQYPNTTTPVLTFSGPTWNGQALTNGWISIQSESQPCEFRKIELMELPQ